MYGNVPFKLEGIATSDFMKFHFDRKSDLVLVYKMFIIMKKFLFLSAKLFFFFMDRQIFGKTCVRSKNMIKNEITANEPKDGFCNL